MERRAEIDEIENKNTKTTKQSWIFEKTHRININVPNRTAIISSRNDKNKNVINFMPVNLKLR